jgi:hypothetical protein
MHGPMTYSCDAHYDWRDNLRAICLGLERLRLVERTGIISRGEQYTGFRALPAAVELTPAMTVEEAARVIAAMIGEPGGWELLVNTQEIFKTTYRSAAAKVHPDNNAGDAAAWHQLQVAAEILKKHHGL